MSTLFDDLPFGGPSGSGGGRGDTGPAVLAGAPAARRSRTGLDPAALVAGLNPQQRQAVVHAGSPLLIVAGAGSGKTRVLTHRIAHLLAEGRATAGQVLAITFTNKAAAEMRERVAALVGDVVGMGARSMWVSTFHSACVRILRREAQHLGMRTSFSIYDSADSQRLMAMVGRELELDPKKHAPRAMSAMVSNLKNELVDEDTFFDRAHSGEGTETEKVLARAYRRTSSGCARPTPWTSTTSSCRPSTCCRRSRTWPSTTADGSGTSWSTSTRTPTTRSTCW